MLAGLALDLTGLVVALLDRGGEVTVRGDHEERDVRLRGAGDHVLDEIAVTGGVDDGVVPVVGEELLGGAGDGHTTLALLLLAVHVEREGEGGLAEGIGLSLELLDLTLGDAAELEDEAAGRGRLTGVDVTADDDGKVLLAVGSHFELLEKVLMEREGAGDWGQDRDRERNSPLVLFGGRCSPCPVGGKKNRVGGAGSAVVGARSSARAAETEARLLCCHDGRIRPSRDVVAGPQARDPGY